MNTSHWSGEYSQDLLLGRNERSVDRLIRRQHCGRRRRSRYVDEAVLHCVFGRKSACVDDNSRRNLILSWKNIYAFGESSYEILITYSGD